MAVGFIGIDFEAEPLILDPFGTFLCLEEAIGSKGDGPPYLHLLRVHGQC